MARVLVVGNVNADQVLRLERPWRRGHDLGIVDDGFRLGGAAANAASALALAGNDVRLVGAIGDDEAGDAVAAALAGLPLDASGVRRVAGPTPRCLILLEPDGERTILSVRGSQRPTAWPPAFDLTGVAGVYVAARTPPPAGLFAGAAEAGASVVVQYRSRHAPPMRVDAVVASADELPADDPWAAVQQSGTICQWLVVTRGAAGASLYDRQTRRDFDAVPADVVDATGAGDAFAAGLVHGLARRWPIGDCLGVALRWGALAVAHEGSTAPPGVARDNAIASGGLRPKNASHHG